MKLTEHLLKISGVEFETNSNCYALVWDGGLALIDCGYGEKQWRRMEAALNRWGHSLSEATHVFLTHAHFDHGGNAKRVNDRGGGTLARIPKDSFYWYKKLIASNGADLD